MDILSAIVNYPAIDTDRYVFNGRNVPRITAILSQMLHEDFLMSWSNSLGFKRQSYKQTLQRAADIGQHVHDSIEKFLMSGYVSLESVQDDMLFEVTNGLESFISWYKYMKNNYDIKVIGMEQKLICPYYGGTYDLLLEVDGKLYLIDFKTSNHIGYKYFIQGSVYKKMLEDIGYIIEGIVILQLNKNEIKYNQYFLLSNNIEHSKYMDTCIQTFNGLVYSYYGRLHLEQGFNNILMKDHVIEMRE